MLVSSYLFYSFSAEELITYSTRLSRRFTVVTYSCDNWNIADVLSFSYDYTNRDIQIVATTLVAVRSHIPKRGTSNTVPTWHRLRKGIIQFETLLWFCQVIIAHTETLAPANIPTFSETGPHPVRTPHCIGGFGTTAVSTSRSFRNIVRYHKSFL